MLTHRNRRGFLVFSVSRADVQYRNAPGIFFHSVQLDVVLFSRQAFALGFNGEVVRNLLTYTLPPIVPKLGHEERMFVKFLATIAIEAITAQKIIVTLAGIRCIHILGDEEPAWPAHCLALRRT